MAGLSFSAFGGGFSYFDRPDDADIFSQTAISNDIYVRGFGFAWGDIHFKSESGAVVNSQQSARDNNVRIGQSSNSAAGGGNALLMTGTAVTFNGSALVNAVGNIGVNIAAGAGNPQNNRARDFRCDPLSSANTAGEPGTRGPRSAPSPARTSGLNG
jgi:hypothetical protein